MLLPVPPAPRSLGPTYRKVHRQPKYFCFDIEKVEIGKTNDVSCLVVRPLPLALRRFLQQLRDEDQAEYEQERDRVQRGRPQHEAEDGGGRGAEAALNGLEAKDLEYREEKEIYK